MIKEMTVKDLRQMLSRLKKENLITDKTKITMSCDEEGNSFSPLAMIDGAYNVGVPEVGGKDVMTLYPL